MTSSSKYRHFKFRNKPRCGLYCVTIIVLLSWLLYFLKYSKAHSLIRRQTSYYKYDVKSPLWHEHSTTEDTDIPMYIQPVWIRRDYVQTASVKKKTTTKNRSQAVMLTLPWRFFVFLSGMWYVLQKSIEHICYSSLALYRNSVVFMWLISLIIYSLLNYTSCVA